MSTEVVQQRQLRIANAPSAVAPMYEVQVGRQTEYARLRHILNRGKHPTYIGSDMTAHAAKNGGLFFFLVDGADAACALVNPSYNGLLVLCVIPSHRKSGLGSAIVRFLKCNWVRALESAVPFFTRLGYVSVGAIKKGRTLRTQVMVRQDLIGLAGRLSRFFEATAQRDHPAQTEGTTPLSTESAARKPRRRTKANTKALPRKDR